MEPQLCKILKVDHPKKGKKDVSVAFTIYGEWESPNWSHNETRVHYGDGKNELDILYFGKPQSGISIDIPKPFEQVIDLRFPGTGTWTIWVHGRHRTIQTSMEIT